MKIAIVTLTTTARRTGVAEYLINLIDQLQEIDHSNHYYIFTGKDNRYMFKLSSDNFMEIRLPLTHDPGFLMRPLFYCWLTFVLPLWCKKHKVNLVHLPNTLFASGLFPTVTTIHDIVELKTKKYSRLRTVFRKLMINSCIRNSKSVITVSNSSAKDIVELGATNVAPIHLGFNNPFASFDATTARVNEVLKKHNLLGAPYLLFIGTLLRHKNIPVLLEAFKISKREIPLLKLVLIGAPDNDFSNIIGTVQRLGLDTEVSILNYMEQNEKLVILKNSSIFCFISSYEGFGIPILEAQAAGVPVIVNNISSLPEVGGDGVFLVSSSNLVEETAKAIEKLMTDRNAREELIKKGHQNLTRFLWRDFAQKTLTEYSKLI
jgi:glycosyltransferase involved in cell wall biosynthesis